MDKTARPIPRAAGPPWPGVPAGEDPFRILVENMRDCAMFLLDRDGRVRSWNPGAELILGYPADEITGQQLAVLYTPAEVARAYPARAMENAARFGRFEDEGWRVRKDGMRFWAHSALIALRDADGEIYGYAKVLRDLTERVQQQEALRRSEERSTALRDQAIRDPLTAAYNRRFLYAHLRETIDRAVLMTASVLMLDIDHFKAINDNFGHDAGDAVLVSLAALANQLSRGSDMLFRMGGDEFVLYLPGATYVEAYAIAERLRAAVEQSQMLMNQVITISIGIAELRPEDSVETWIQGADAALYNAKRAGRNRVA